ncbi:MAG: chromophore lyase CpcT/CpeT [Candidatus Kapabacteria bacterium]|nr:chromophore lyase CpcT/CpeT [Candidatus Kapabacteria bacterium]
MKPYIAPVLMLCAFALALASCSTSTPVQRLTSLMQGSFSSAEQHKRDTANYFDIRLHVARIWKHRSDGVWLYVEQAIARSIDKPYRQRVYHITQLPDGRFESAVFTMNEPLRFAGEWKKSEPLTSLTPDSLTPRTGCSVFLKADGNSFTGSTDGSLCPSDLRGAKYATSEVTITSDRMVSWDRGFDDKGEQIWGATKGGYQFLRVND